MILIEELFKIIPHRYPMLLVDRILEMDPPRTCKGLKNVSINEAFFQGHYPGFPVMPGVLIIEAMAQAGCIMILSAEENRGKVPLIGSIDKVKLRRQVVPGDQLITDAELVEYRPRFGVGKMHAVASVNGEMAATMELTFKLIDRKE